MKGSSDAAMERGQFELIVSFHNTHTHTLIMTSEAALIWVDIPGHKFA